MNNHAVCKGTFWREHLQACMFSVRGCIDTNNNVLVKGRVDVTGRVLTDGSACPSAGDMRMRAASGLGRKSVTRCAAFGACR